MMDALLLRRRRRGRGPQLHGDEGRLRVVLQADRGPGDLGRGRHGRHGRELLARVHGPRRGGRRRPVLQRGERLRREPGEGEERPRARGDLRTRRPPGRSRSSRPRASSRSPRSRRRRMPCPRTGSSRRSSTSATAGPSPSSCAAATNSRRPSSAPSVSRSCGRRPPRRSSRSWAPSPGSLGAVRGTIRNRAALAGIFADHAIRLVGNGTTGRQPGRIPPAQRQRRPRPGRDRASATFGACRRASPTRLAGRPLKVRRGIEVGHIFKLGTKYSERIDAGYTDDKKESHLFVMGCYGIGISRTLQALIEQSHDADGIIWPWADRALPGARLPAGSPGHRGHRDRRPGSRPAAERAGADVLSTTAPSGPGSSSRTPT